MIAVFLSPFYIAMNIYIVIRLLRWLGACHTRLDHPAVWAAVITVYVFFALSPLTGMLITAEPVHRWLKFVSNYWTGIMLLGAVALIIGDSLRLILNRTLWKGNHPNRRRFVAGGMCVVIAVLGIGGYGITHGSRISVREETLTVYKQAQVDELRIALIADLHMGYNSSVSRVQKVIDAVDAENPDIVVIAGDIFDNEYDAIPDKGAMIETVKEMTEKYPTYACWGNHDVEEKILVGFTFGGGAKDDSGFRQFLSDSGIILLEDETVLTDEGFYIAGRRDPSKSEKEGHDRLTPSELLEDLDKTKPVIVIDHQPGELEELAEAGADIDLSGHTHDGQIFPGNLTVKLAWENPYGVKQVGNMTSFVTSGAGVWGPPMRVGTDSEVMIIDVNFK